MAFQVSPGINTSEINLSTIVPAVSTTSGGIGGLFRWGPIGQIVLVDSEPTLVRRYGKPTNYNAETWFTASSFLAYGNQLYVSRAGNTTDTSANGCWSAIGDSSNTVANAVANGTYSGANVSTVFFPSNPTMYYNAANAGSFTGQSSYNYIAKYPGAIGSSLMISQCDTATEYSSNLVNIANTVFVNNSNTGNIFFNDSTTIIAAATAAANLASYVAWTALTTGDFITVGNSSIGTQNLQIANKGVAPVFITNNSATFTNGSNTVTNLTGMSNAMIGLSVGSSIAGIANNTLVTAVANATSVQLSANFTGTTGSGTLKLAQEFLSLSFYTPYTLAVGWTPATSNVGRLWQYYSAVPNAPGTSTYVTQFGNTAAVDEVHVVISDALGMFTGVPGQVLEVFRGLSRASDALTVNGQTNYYVNVLNQQSQYVWWTNHRGGAGYVANSAQITSTAYTTPLSIQFAGGQDGFSEANTSTNIGTITAAYDLFNAVENAPISLLMTGKSDDTNTYLLGNYLIQNICAVRKDCIAFISPNKSTVVNNLGYEYSSIATFRNGLTASSYGVLDSGYKYTYDRYNDVYRYVPLNGDIAGVCVYTDNTRDPWWSPAGLNRGQIKNVISLAYNPKQAERDYLYPLGVNPVITKPGQGTFLFGDKTLEGKSDAFDRINVRRLFIVLEKAIAAAAQSFLFEFNNAFTQAQFVSMVTPFLKTVQGRQGITDFKVVCDNTNNTAQVVDANQFVGDIYIKPAKSINYIQLNFIAVRSDVAFNEVTAQF